MPGRINKQSLGYNSKVERCHLKSTELTNNKRRLGTIMLKTVDFEIQDKNERIGLIIFQEEITNRALDTIPRLGDVTLRALSSQITRGDLGQSC